VTDGLIPRRFQQHELGLLLPLSSSTVRPPEPARHVGTYLTYGELTSGPLMSERGVVERLTRLSAADCMFVLALLGTRLFAGQNRGGDEDVQHQLIDLAVGDGPLSVLLHEKQSDPRWTAIFCEQQLVHLARLVVLHADPRPHDDFASGALYEDWLTCLIGVTDLLDADLVVEDRDARLSWEIRQAQLNHHADQLPATAVHYELYSVLWERLGNARVAETDQAFRSVTGISIEGYFTIGSAVTARLINHGQNNDGFPGVEPKLYFSNTRVEENVWQAFFRLVSRDLESLRTELLREQERYGATTYGSLTFERFPLVEVEPGMYLPTSVSSLQRRITEGVFHILAEAAEAEGHDRRRYTSPFGDVFQRLVEDTVRRGAAIASPTAPIVADVLYGGRRRSRRSSDVIVAEERNPVFIEVVSGPLQAATATRGDLTCFWADLERLVVRKAKQLDRNIRDFLKGDLIIDGVDPAVTSHAWPVILMSHAFPHAETVMEEVHRAVAAQGYLRHPRAGALAIVSAEDLFFCEGHMQQGRSLLSLLRSWKSGSGANLSFKNELVALGGGRAPGSDHFERRFAEATARYMNRLFESGVTADDVLQHAKQGKSRGHPLEAGGLPR
jgi:hypothetical protein